jgi:hypothetical protein
MSGFMPGIHVFSSFDMVKAWMAGPSPAMTAVAISATSVYEM